MNTQSTHCVHNNNTFEIYNYLQMQSNRKQNGKTNINEFREGYNKGCENCNQNIYSDT